MSRSSHHYYNLCTRPVNEDGLCEFHSWWRRPHRCIPEGEYLTRRGLVRRKKRFPEGSIKSWHCGPTAWWKKDQHRRARAQQKREFLKNPEDPVITPMRRLINLWNWY